MKKERILTLIVLMVLISFTLFGYIDFEENDNSSERAKIALRDSGNKLLLSVGDSTSLIMPVVELDENTFELSFQNELHIEPVSLASILGERPVVINALAHIQDTARPADAVMGKFLADTSLTAGP